LFSIFIGTNSLPPSKILHSSGGNLKFVRLGTRCDDLTTSFVDACDIQESVATSEREINLGSIGVAGR
jgi:hypothetical protein